jgi:hypothetical protein
VALREQVVTLVDYEPKYEQVMTLVGYEPKYKYVDVPEQVLHVLVYKCA